MKRQQILQFLPPTHVVEIFSKHRIVHAHTCTAVFRQWGWLPAVQRGRGLRCGGHHRRRFLFVVFLSFLGHCRGGGVRGGVRGGTGSLGTKTCGRLFGKTTRRSFSLLHTVLFLFLRFTGPAIGTTIGGHQCHFRQFVHQNFFNSLFNMIDQYFSFFHIPLTLRPSNSFQFALHHRIQSMLVRREGGVFDGFCFYADCRCRRCRRVLFETSSSSSCLL